MTRGSGNFARQSEDAIRAFKSLDGEIAEVHIA